MSFHEWLTDYFGWEIDENDIPEEDLAMLEEEYRKEL